MSEYWKTGNKWTSTVLCSQLLLDNLIGEVPGSGMMILLGSKGLTK